MPSAVHSRIPDAAEVVALDAQQVVQLVRSQAAQIEALRAQLESFKRQVFGQKSERYPVQPDAQQMHLGECLGEQLGELTPATEPSPQPQDVPAHKRRRPRSDFADDATSVPFFDEAKVPVLSIELPNPEVQHLAPDQYEVVGQKVSHRLAQRPGACMVLRYVRQVIKRRDTATLHCPPAPAGVIEGSRADVSFIVGVLVDKFLWHRPLYRQHQRLIQAGFELSRPCLTQLVSQAAQLLEPIYGAQLESIRSSRVKAVDETPIKACRAGPGKMKAGYFWPVYGEHREVCFPFFDSRRHDCVKALLGDKPKPGEVLLSDGDAAYSHSAEATGVTHAQCWAHMRRGFFDALSAAPQEADCALQMIGKVYEAEATIGQKSLSGEHKRLHRLEHANLRVEQFFG